ncbi:MULTISPECIES: zinc-binding alcohol dehydrogenase family protein [unclassified Microbulbifer]|uniref:zinc-binding alcohol dehydrogenase family protein n=1 Tax=unclassified Microbulbifer TaxID=2619833 RepID=UPI0027E3F62E|nr:MULTISPECIES: zinc-binding alcohol dehydrogenase family protein [unclassified Microbulbifer]
MKAIGYYNSLPVDDEQSLVGLELPRPSPGPRDILVKIEAVSVNPVDTKVRANAAPPEGNARILGFDAAGTVEEVGAEVMLFKKGDQVFYAGAIDRPGSNSEYQLVDERIAARKPESLSFAEAAALPLTSITAWELLFDRLRVPYGIKTQNDALLIINGAGGVGSILTQLARRLTGLTVIATASRPETVAWCQSMGAHHVINHHNPLDRELKEIGIPRVRYVASLTGTEQHLPAIIELLEPLGAMAVIDDPATLDIKPFKSKGLSVHWEYMFARPVYQTADMIEQHRLLSEVAALVDAGVLKTTLKEELGTINAANLRRAHGKQESGRCIGKNVLAGF